MSFFAAIANSTPHSILTHSAAQPPRAARFAFHSLFLEHDLYSWSMIFFDLPSPAEASSYMGGLTKGFAQAGNRYPLFGIML
jgi:hypothetical protein